MNAANEGEPSAERSRDSCIANILGVVVDAGALYRPESSYPSVKLDSAEDNSVPVADTEHIPRHTVVGRTVGEMAGDMMKGRREFPARQPDKHGDICGVIVLIRVDAAELVSEDRLDVDEKVAAENTSIDHIHIDRDIGIPVKSGIGVDAVEMSDIDRCAKRGQKAVRTWGLSVGVSDHRQPGPTPKTGFPGFR